MVPKFVPPVSTSGDRDTLSLTLLDGSVITTSYPRDLRLAALGVNVNGSIYWQSNPESITDACCSRALNIRYGTIQDIFGNATPTKTFPDAFGNPVPYYDQQSDLAITVGHWTVLVNNYNGPGTRLMTDDELATYAHALTGHETPDGYLVLTPAAPLTLKGIDAADIMFGSTEGPTTVSFFRGLHLGCPTTTRTTPGALHYIDTTTPQTLLCSIDHNVTVFVGGTHQVRHAVANGIRLR